MRSKIQYLPMTILIVVGVLVWVFMASDAIAWYPATYAESAHGDPTSGVNRSGTECPTGDCAHCHDTFDESICGVKELMLFAPMYPIGQTYNFCFQCHASNGAAQQVTNYDYGATFGGGEAMSDNIKDAFNFGPPNQAADGTTGSSHNLMKVRNWWKAVGGSGWMTDDTNACLACHDPHIAQKNWEVTLNPQLGGILTAIRHPSAIDAGKRGNLWGDESGTGDHEVQSELFYGVYQAPLHHASGYEPDGSASQPAGGWGANMPNYNLFCWGCHSYEIPAVATDAEPSWINPSNPKGLWAIDWSPSGNDHGAHAASPNTDTYNCACDEFPNGEYGSLKPPYDNPDANYVLACTDCHEPHGSESAFLLRTVVNGQPVTPIKQWLGTMESEGKWEFCTACHNLNIPCGPHQCVDELGAPLDCRNFGCGQCHLHSNWL
ncbi:MAG: hypothetical protein JRI47_04765 [Deltaproteobacteria bacterium]|nr:hypothetical protein [Deltaproteobacteria bacterium]